MKNFSMRRKKIILITLIMLVIVAAGLFALKQLRGHGYFSAAKNYLHYYMNKPDFSQYEPLVEDEDAWYQKQAYIAHALGGIEQQDYTNSLEAFQLAYKNGFKVFEVDFAVTSDGQVVCAHDFVDFGDVVPDYSTFMNQKISGQYTPLDMQGLIDLLYENEDIYLMTDFKWDNSLGSNNHDVEIIMSSLIACIEERQDESLYDRMIIQIYSEDNFRLIESYHQFSNYVYTLYNYAYPIYDEIAAFCLENQIAVVTMSADRATDEHVALFEQWNIKVFSHTINTKEEATQQFQNGVKGIYTDWLLPTE